MLKTKTGVSFLILRFYIIKKAGQSEPVEDSRAEALPTMLRQAQHDLYFLVLSGSSARDPDGTV